MKQSKRGKSAAAIAVAICMMTGLAVTIYSAEKASQIEDLEINLNNYLTVSYSGNSGEGTAQAVFDCTSFQKDYGDRICAEDAERKKAIGGDLFPAKKIKNGDTLYFSWHIDEDALKLKHATLKYSDIQKKVEDLPEPSKTYKMHDNFREQGTDEITGEQGIDEIIEKYDSIGKAAAENMEEALATDSLSVDLQLK